MRKNKFLIIYLSLLLVLNSCGFQLRKPIELNYKSYSIIGDNSQITKLIHKQLSFANMERLNDDSSDLVIEIMRNSYEKRILSLARTGVVGEFELIQKIEYRFKTNGIWSQPRQLETLREYTYDPILYNAAAAEEKFLRESMEEQLSRSLLTEINNIGK